VKLADLLLVSASLPVVTVLEMDSYLGHEIVLPSKLSLYKNAIAYKWKACCSCRLPWLAIRSALAQTLRAFFLVILVSLHWLTTPVAKKTARYVLSCFLLVCRITSGRNVASGPCASGLQAPIGKQCLNNGDLKNLCCCIAACTLRVSKHTCSHAYAKEPEVVLLSFTYRAMKLL